MGEGPCRAGHRDRRRCRAGRGHRPRQRGAGARRRDHRPPHGRERRIGRPGWCRQRPRARSLPHPPAVGRAPVRGRRAGGARRAAHHGCRRRASETGRHNLHTRYPQHQAGYPRRRPGCPGGAIGGRGGRCLASDCPCGRRGRPRSRRSGRVRTAGRTRRPARRRGGGVPRGHLRGVAPPYHAGRSDRHKDHARALPGLRDQRRHPAHRRLLGCQAHHRYQHRSWRADARPRRLRRDRRSPQGHPRPH
jgi:hypothetical protein